MEDPTTIALNLTFFGTLGVAFVMFIGLFLVFVATLLMAGLGRLVGVAVMALVGRRPARSSRPAGSSRPAVSSATIPGRGPRRPKPQTQTHPQARAGTVRHEAPALSQDWTAAVARADARADARAKAAAAPEVKVTVRDLPSPDAPVEEVTAIAPLVESATDQHATVKAIPRSFEKPPAPGRMAMLDTGSLVSLAGHPGTLKGTLPAQQRRAG
jgi:predicted lipid-binding transport protein (Tim44 family)